MKFKILLSIIISIFAFIFINYWLIKFIAVFYITTIAFSYAYSYIIYFAINIKREKLLIRSEKSKKIELVLILKNTSYLPVHYLFISDKPGGLYYPEKSDFVFSLKIKEKKVIKYTAMGNTRGVYIVGPIIIKGSDPLGLFPWEKKIDSICNVIVYPSVNLVLKENKNGIFAGNLKTANKIYEDTTRYRSVRKYIPKDELKRINWKISAKKGALHTTEYMFYFDAPVLILLNLTDKRYSIRKKYYFIEKAIDIASSLLYYFIALGQSVGFISSGIIEGNIPVIKMNRGYIHAVLILENLAKIQENKNEIDVIDLFYDHKIRPPQKTRIIYITPSVLDNEFEKLNLIKKNGYFIDVVALKELGSKDFYDFKSKSNLFTHTPFKEYRI